MSYLHLQQILCGSSSPSSHAVCHVLVFTVLVWMLGHCFHDRRELVQHEDHRRHQAWHEKDCCWTRPPPPQKPGAKGGSGGGVWCELSWHAARKRKGRPETAFAHLEWRVEMRTQWLALVPVAIHTHTQPHIQTVPPVHMDLLLTNVQFLFFS